MLAAAVALRHPPGAAAAVRLLTPSPSSSSDHGGSESSDSTSSSLDHEGMALRLRHIPPLLEEVQELAHTSIPGLLSQREGLPKGTPLRRQAALAVARATEREREVWAVVEAVLHG